MIATTKPLPFDSADLEEMEKVRDVPHINIDPKLKKVNRSQLIIRCIELERLIPMDHIARAIWDFVGTLDLQAFYNDIKSINGESGCPSTDPQTLISVWVYAYTQGISSAREISRIMRQLFAFQWLSADTDINHHTLSDFRVKNEDTLNDLFTQILAVLQAEEIISLEQTAHDGTKILAQAGADSFRREETLKKSLDLATQRVKEMESAENTGVNPRSQKAQERAAKEKLSRLEKASEELKKIRAIKDNEKERLEARVSLTDPECRNMKQSDAGFAPSYNVQITTEAKNGAIVGVGIVQAGNDSAELPESMDRVKQQAGEYPEQTLVDGGYTNRPTIIAMADKGIDMIGSVSELPKEYNLNKDIAPEFQSKNFIYNPEKDEFVCPPGEVLKYSSTHEEPGRTTDTYKASFDTCKGCPNKDKCCPKNKTCGRSVSRSTESAVVIAFKEKMKTEEAKAIYKKRGPIAEFTNAWLKDKLNLRKFRLKGLVKAGMEAMWACITYNIQILIRINRGKEPAVA